MSVTEDMADLDDALRNAGSGPLLDREHLYPPDSWKAQPGAMRTVGDLHNDLNRQRAMVQRLQGQWNSIPWRAIDACAVVAAAVWTPEAQEVQAWLDCNAPQETTP